MASDCHNNYRNGYQHQFLRQIDPEIWKACAGTSVQIPELGSRVYYFPQGHMEQSSAPQIVNDAFNHLPPRPYLACRVLQVLLLADPDTDEVCVRYRLEPVAEQKPFPIRRTASSLFGIPAGKHGGDGGDVKRDQRDQRVVSFVKVLTPSDANNGGGFSVPKFCAETVLPKLNYVPVPPLQMLDITDVQGESWNFRHIFRGTPKRHLLTTGWSKFVNRKKLIAGDSIVFMRDKETDKLYFGIRRAPRSNSALETSKWTSQYMAMALKGGKKVEEKKEGGFYRSVKGKVSPESVLEAVEMAVKNMPFEVMYYPKASRKEFVVDGEKVDAAMGMYWAVGVRLKMAVENEGSSRRTWLQGSITSVTVPDCKSWQRSPWRMLQVDWDEPEAGDKVKRVCPWQVQIVSVTPAIDIEFQPAKRARVPQNCGTSMTDEASLSLPPTGFSNSPIGPSGPSYLIYSSFPAGMQGARQDTFSVSSEGNGGTSQLPPKVEIVSTDLSMSSPHSDIISPPSSSSSLCSPDFAGMIPPKGGITSFQLFGQTIYGGSVERDKRVVGAKEYFANTSTKGKGVMETPLDLRTSDPSGILTDKI